MSKTNPKRPQFPYRSSDDKAVDQARQVEKARYYHSIRYMSAEILTEAAQRYEDYEDAQEFIQDQIHETADGTSMVIMTGEALQTLIDSDNWTAAEDEGADLPTSSISDLVSVLAYYAVSADLRETIESIQDEYFVEDDDEDDD